jgi:hypothetical protein
MAQLDGGILCLLPAYMYVIQCAWLPTSAEHPPTPKKISREMFFFKGKRASH